MLLVGSRSKSTIFALRFSKLKCLVNITFHKFQLTKTSPLLTCYRVIITYSQTGICMPIPATAGDTDAILGQENPLQMETGTCSSILVWKIPWKEKPGVLESMGLQRVTHDLVTQQPQTSQLFTILLLSLEYLLHVSGYQSFTKCRIKNKLVS